MKFTPPLYLQCVPPTRVSLQMIVELGTLLEGVYTPVEDLGGHVTGHGSADGGADQLGQDVAHRAEQRHLARDRQAQRHGGVDIRTRDT
jgi:nucleoid-associated protein YgaU